MSRLSLLSLALLAVPAAASANGYYRAETTTAPSQERFVARENVWRCTGETCISARSGSRPAIVCATLAREVGALRSFAVEGRAFGAEELENCNRRAR